MNKRLIAMAAMAMVGGAWAQDLEQKVSYSGSATTAKQFLETLGSQTGLILSTTPQTGNDVLIVKVENVQLMDLLKRIATACGAEWKQETGGYRLIRPEALAREQRLADLAARAKAFEAPLKRLVDTVAAVPMLDEAQARKIAEDARQLQESAMRGQFRAGPRSDLKSPASRALVRLLASLSTTTIAGIETNTRVVYASSPNRMQRTLGAASNSILAKLVQEHNTYARELGDTPRETAPPNTRVMVLGGPDLTAKPIDRLGKALVIFTRGADGALNAELKVADASGAIVARATQYLVPDASPAPANLNETGKAITLSTQAREYATLMAGPAAAASSDRRVMRISLDGGGGGNFTFSSDSTSVPAVSDEWKQRLSQPEKFEPHEFVAGTVLREIATSEERHLVANLNDGTLIPVCRRLLNAKLTPNQFLGFLSVEMDLEVSREDGWLQISARHPSEVRDARIDRSALGGLLRSALKNGFARLDEMASYALRQPDGLPDGTFDERTIRLLSPDAGQDFQFNGRDRRSMLKLYGLMGASQRQLLVRGGSIQLGALDPRQAALLHTMVFNASNGPNIQIPQEAGPRGRQPQNEVQQVIAIAAAQGQTLGGMPAFMGQGDANLIQERTEALPIGVPGDGILTLRYSQQEAAMGVRGDGSDARFLAADQLASDLAAQSNPELAAFTGGGTGPYAKFRAAVLTQFDFQFQLSQIASLGRQLRDADIPEGAPITGYDGLSANFRRQVQAMQARMREGSQRATALPGFRIGGPPPP